MYCIYLRKSRKDIEAESKGEGETLKRHENILIELSRKMKITIDKIYREVVSGETISSRPVMQELLSDIEKGIYKGVLVVEVERLARGDTIDQGIVAQAFKYTNTKIITPVKTYDPSNEFDEEYFEFGLFMSRREFKTTNRRLQRGRLESVKEGKFVGTVAPYGYNRVKLKGQKGYTLEIRKDEYKTVKLIFKWYTTEQKQEDGTYERIGISIIANKLNEMNIPTRKGGDWTVSTIRGILSNPVYIGKIRWNNRPQVKKVVDGEVVKQRPRAKAEDIILVEGLHPAIIDLNTFNLADYYLSENPSVPVPSRHKVKNPLAGLVICGVCNRKMNRKPYNTGYPSSLLCTGPTCDNVSSPLYLVEERTLKILGEWLLDYKVKFKNSKSNDDNIQIDLLQERIKDIDEELKTLDNQFNSLHDFLEQGIYDTNTFLDRSKFLSKKIKTAKENKKELNKKLNNLSVIENNKKEIIPKVENILNIYDTLDNPKEKNDLLKEVIDKIVYTKEKGGRWSGEVDNFTLKLYPRLPRQ